MEKKTKKKKKLQKLILGFSHLDNFFLHIGSWRRLFRRIFFSERGGGGVKKVFREGGGGGEEA